MESAFLRLTTDEPQAERLAGELMTLVALRWRRLARSDARHSLNPGASADLYLTQLFHQEAGELGYPDTQINLESRAATRIRPILAGRLPLPEEASLVWESARRRLRRRLLIGFGFGVVVAAAALCQRGASDPKPAEPQPLAGATELPPGAKLLPAGPFSAKPLPRVPEKLALPTERVPTITSAPLERTLLLVAARPAAVVHALGDNGSWRVVDTAPPDAAALMGAGCLSPDGKAAAFASLGGSVIVDLTSGHVESLAGVRTSTQPVWLGPRRVLFGETALLDRDRSELMKAPVGPEHVVTPLAGGPEAPVVELLSPGQPLTAPPRVRRWNSKDGTELTTSLGGQFAGLVGPWEGAGFSAGELAVRLCRPGGGVPSQTRIAWLAAALHPVSGQVTGVLLIDTSTSGTPAVLGIESGRVLLALAKEAAQDVVGWDPRSGEVVLISSMSFAARLSLRDLTSAS